MSPSRALSEQVRRWQPTFSAYVARHILAPRPHQPVANFRFLPVVRPGEDGAFRSRTAGTGGGEKIGEACEDPALWVARSHALYISMRTTFPTMKM